jgi:hypothetical protein
MRVVEQGLARILQALEQGRIADPFQVVELQTRLLAAQPSYLCARPECKLQQIELDRITGSGFAPAPQAPNRPVGPGSP